ncbi:unnamed protein product [Urochloa humidicola]
MASSLTISSTSSLLGQSITKKLTKSNFVQWKAQVLPVLQGVQLEGYLDGSNVAPLAEIEVKEGDKMVKAVNPKHLRWRAMDQQVMGFLLTSLPRDILPQVATLATSRLVWTALEKM